MTKHVLQNIIKRISMDCRFNKIEGKITEYNRKVYKDGGEYEEYSFRLSCLVDKGNWFKNSISFYVTIDSYSNNVIVEQRLGKLNRQVFDRNKSINVSNYIFDEISKFQFPNKSELKIKIG